MKRFLVLNLICAVLIGLSALCQTASAVALNLAECEFVLANDCKSVDETSTVTSDKISVSSAGVWTSTCLGTTGVKPTKATKCDGETLNGSMGDPVLSLLANWWWREAAPKLRYLQMIGLRPSHHQAASR
jgi:hypothetical protein